MDRILFILNPIAGGGASRDLKPMIVEEMEKRRIDYALKLTEKPGDGTRLAEEAIAEGYKTIVSVGGDGTLNEIAKSLVDTDLSLGIIPGGSGNDMARSLDIPLDPEEALRNILEHQKRRIDVGYVNGKLFLNIASAGLDSAVVEGAKKYKKKHQGGTAYSISMAENLIKYRKKPMKISIDDEVIDEEVYLVAVGNGKTYGGGFKILPMAQVDDGYFHICVVKKLSKPLLLLVFPSIAFGKHTIFKRYVSIYKSKKVVLETDEDLFLNVDGEISKLKNRTEFVLEKARLNLIY